MSREAIEEAIEVLEDASAEMLMETGDENYYGEAIAALRQALEKEQEPVALPCVYITSQKDGGNCYGDGTVYRGQRSKDSAVKTYTVKTIEAKREWVGLTYEEIQIVASKKWWNWEDLFDIEGFSRAIERVLKEKNT